MSKEKTRVGQIRTETHGHVFKIIIDNPAKKNSFSPQMMGQMSDALTVLHNEDDLWVGVVCAEGSDFTAGLDMSFSDLTPRSGIRSKATSTPLVL
jgi:enoyl-CoA hydratase